MARGSSEVHLPGYAAILALAAAHSSEHDRDITFGHEHYVIGFSHHVATYAISDR